MADGLARTPADEISKVIKREGPETNDPVDKGGRTKYGISEATNPDLWKDGPPTEAQSRERYEQRYVKGPRFDQIKDSRLQAQLIDFGVNSGPMVAIKKLQEILHVPVDGILGPQTLVLANAGQSADTNNKLVAARVKMIGRIVQNNPSQLKFLSGWLNRALEFLV